MGSDSTTSAQSHSSTTAAQTRTLLTGDPPTTHRALLPLPAPRTKEVAVLAGVSAVPPPLRAPCAPADSKIAPPGVVLPSSSWSIAAARITPPSDHTTTWPVTEVGSTTLSTMSCRLATLMATTTTHTSLAPPRRPATASPLRPTPSAPSPTAVPPPRTPNPNSLPLSLRLALSVLLLTPAELASSSTAAEFT